MVQPPRRAGWPTAAPVPIRTAAAEPPPPRPAPTAAASRRTPCAGATSRAPPRSRSVWSAPACWRCRKPECKRELDMCGKGAIAGRSSPTRGAHGEPTRQRAAVESVPAAAAASLGAIGTEGRSLEWPASTLSRNTQRRLAAAVWEIQPVPFPRTGRAVTPCRGRKHPRASMPLGSRKNWRPGGDLLMRRQRHRMQLRRTALVHATEGKASKPPDASGFGRPGFGCRVGWGESQSSHGML